MDHDIDALPSDGGHVTSHRRTPNLYLEVRHSPTHAASTFQARLLHGGPPPDGFALGYPAGNPEHEGKTWVHSGGHIFYGPPMSEQLQAHIASYKNHGAWMPLLDMIAEQFPDLAHHVTSATQLAHGS